MSDGRSRKSRVTGVLAVLALVGTLLIPLAVVTATTASAGFNCGVAQGPDICCDSAGVTQGPGECCASEGVTQGPEICCFDAGSAQGTENGPCEEPPPPGPCDNGHDRIQGDFNGDGNSNCCPDGSLGHWEWGGYAGQNLYWCDAPPDTPPATAEPTPTETPAVSPTAAPKKAAPAAAPAAKPVFTG